ncbi:MAG: sulfotransferase [Firmicutes bacterium]|nr:sulfotransferase [Bacillota bacterium]
MSIAKPIFIIGAGRSGSTIFHKMFANHPNVAWLSGLCDKYPRQPSINRSFMRAIDYPIVGRYLKRIITPGESYGFWEHHCKGFRQPCRDLLPQDVTNKTKDKIPGVLSEMLTGKRNRLLFKITGWPRIGFLQEIFPDAKFIHVVRDGRAVVNSVINTDWWWGWRGPQNWRWGELTPAQREEWEEHNKSFIALAGIQWKILMEAVEKAKLYVDQNNYFEVKYEVFCSQPGRTFRETVDFCELRRSSKFLDSINRHALRDTEHKWKKELTPEQQQIVNAVTGAYLQKHGYMAKTQSTGASR